MIGQLGTLYAATLTSAETEQRPRASRRGVVLRAAGWVEQGQRPALVSVLLRMLAAGLFGNRIGSKSF